MIQWNKAPYNARTYIVRICVYVCVFRFIRALLRLCAPVAIFMLMRTAICLCLATCLWFALQTVDIVVSVRNGWF